MTPPPPLLFPSFQSPVSLLLLTTPQTLLDAVLNLFQHLPTFEFLWLATETLAEPLAALWTVLLHHAPLQTRAKQKSSICDQVASIWLVVTRRLQATSFVIFNSSLLPTLTPLLVATLTSDLPKLISITLNFWAHIFDDDKKLTYPTKLAEAFQKCFETSPRPHGLRLPGLVLGGVSERSRKPGEVLSVEDSVPVSDSNVEEMSETQANTEEVVVLPHNSPMKTLGSPSRRVCSSFLGQGRGGHTFPHKPHPVSKMLDQVLNRLSPSRPPAFASISSISSPISSSTSLRRKSTTPCRRLHLADHDTEVIILN